VAPLGCSRSAHTASLRAPAREGLEARLSPAQTLGCFCAFCSGSSSADERVEGASTVSQSARGQMIYGIFGGCFSATGSSGGS
jgi:hypothetical protein